MASSKKRPANNLTGNQHLSLHQSVKSFFTELLSDKGNIRPALLVAYSGGLDSTVLLHILHQLQSELSFDLTAMHVHHGLSDHADDWASFCQSNCQALTIPIDIRHVQVEQNSGLGIEASARHARYQVLNSERADYICLGHHQDDQAETLLLQLARGAGVKGLAGMPAIDTKRRLLRPLLSCSRETLQAYAKHHALQWIEDDSNRDSRFDRNFIRHHILPPFSERYPQLSRSIARSAHHLAEVNTLLTDLASLDAEIAIDSTQQYGALKLEQLFQLSVPRQGNLIRWWLAENHIEMPSAALLNQLLVQLQSVKNDASIKVKVAEDFAVMRYQGLAYLVHQAKNTMPIDIVWQGEEVVILPDLSRLFFTKQKGQGVVFQDANQEMTVHIKSRQGAESLRPAPNRPRRHLKYLMQEQGIPPWQRERLPLIYINNKLAIIPNIAIDIEQQVAPEGIGLSVNWES